MFLLPRRLDLKFFLHLNGGSGLPYDIDLLSSSDPVGSKWNGREPSCYIKIVTHSIGTRRSQQGYKRDYRGGFLTLSIWSPDSGQIGQ